MNSSCSELRRARPLLGTLVDIRAGGSDRRTLAHAIDAAFCEIARVHRLMSFHDPDSDVSKINRGASRSVVRVHPHTMEVLRHAQYLSAASRGGFDITVASRLVERGMLPRSHATRTDEAADWHDLELLADGGVRCHRPLLIDLGGIAKGYAVDLATAALGSGGAAWGCVNAGGDLRAFGRAQSVHVRNPYAHWQSIPLTEIADSAVATSARYHGDPQMGTIIHPRQADPATGNFSVTVAAARCVIADGLTKVVHLLGEAAAELLRSHGARAWVIRGESLQCDETAFA